MRLPITRVYFLYVALVSASAGASSIGAEFDGHFIRSATLKQALAIDKYSREPIPKNGEAPWPRRFPEEFDVVVPGQGTVLVLHRATACSGTPGQYVSSDCGHEETIVVAQPSLIAKGDILDLTSVSTGVLAALFEGPRFSPGRSGCFGFPASGSMRVRDVRAESIETDIDAVFVPFNLFHFPARCPELRIRQSIIFHIASISSERELNARDIVAGSTLDQP